MSPVFQGCSENKWDLKRCRYSIRQSWQSSYIVVEGQAWADEMMSWNPHVQERALETGRRGSNSWAFSSKCAKVFLAKWLLLDITSWRRRVQLLGQAQVTIFRLSQGALAHGHSRSSHPQSSHPARSLGVFGREPCARRSLRASKPKKKQLSFWWN